jgi:hypothetical protein
VLKEPRVQLIFGLNRTKEIPTSVPTTHPQSSKVSCAAGRPKPGGKLIWKTWQHNAPAEETREPKESFDAWASQSFATRTGALSGREAAMQILLPIAAVSIGMFIFGLVYYFDIPHAGY